MKTRLLVSLLLLIPLAGTLVRSVPPPRKSILVCARDQSVQTSLLNRLKHVPAEFATGNFRQAEAIARLGYDDAMRARELRIAARFLNNVGGCQLALHQYRHALETYLEARALAETSGDQTEAGKLDFNISSLYSQLGQIDAAMLALDAAAASLVGPERARQLPKLLIQKAAMEADQGRLTAAVPLYRQGTAAADRIGDLEMYAIGWNDLGYEFLEHGQLRQAEQALLEAYRVRKLNRLRSVESSYRNLGMLRLEQGDTRSAAVLLDLAVTLSRQPGGLRPSWEVYYARGRARMAEKRLRDALDDLRMAARLARNWRREAPPGDATRVSTENFIQKVHSALIEAGNELYFETHDPALPQETFESAEANRAASLRALLAEPRDWRRNLPPEYWETLQTLESAEAQLLRTPESRADAAHRIQQLQTALFQWESQAGSDTDVEIPGLLDRTRHLVAPDAAYFAFHLTSPNSYLWAVSRERFALYRLPAGSEIGALVKRFSSAVRDGYSGDITSVGAQLFDILFGRTDAAFRRKHRWLLALDAQLFELPFAALTTATGGHARFLAEWHSLEITSGAGMLTARGTQASNGPFVAVADAIYNEADPRWSGARSASAPFRELLQAHASDRETADLHLARLAGSAREVAACAAAWGGPPAPLLLEGAAASRQRLQAALQSHPAVLHLAAHVVHSSQHSGSGLIVLSLSRDAQHDVLSPVEIATWNLEGAVVALSGCSSGTADALPATGLMGLTRACQAAGARAVVASRWPTLDDAGSVFLSFYRHLRAAPQAGSAVALQLAQIDMLRSNTWRANPQYWSAYFVTGNQQ